jgi:adenylate cyclase
MPFKLIRTEGDQAFDLRGPEPLVLGRAITTDLPVFDPTVSRRHAEVRCGDDGVEVRDLGSSNGTFVNGARVTVTRVAVGDVLKFGKVAFRLHDAAVAPPPATPSGASQTPVARGGLSILRRLRVGDSVSSGAGRALRDAGTDRSTQRLALLLEVATGLAGAVDVNALLEKIAAYTFDILDVDRVSILLADGGGELQQKVSRDRRGSDAGRAVPTSIARIVVEEKSAVLSDNAPEDERFGGESILRQRVRSAMCAPLIGAEERVLGLVYVDNLTTTNRFADADLELLVAFAGIAAVAIGNSQLAERSRREAAVRANFERYFAPALAARIAESPTAATLGGEKRTVAVLFSDIRGFTTLAERLRPDEVAALLTEYFTEMVECVFRNGGTLDKFIGDAVMAQWGAPIGAPDDADRALTAAADMMAALDALNVKWRAAGRQTLEVGIGLSHGEAFAGNIGSERRLEFTVIGDTVNTARRLCEAAGGGEILISEALREALREPRQLEPCAPIAAKGKSQLVPVYRVAR